MENEKLEGLIIDYIDDRLNAADRQMLEIEFAKNKDARKLYEELKEVMSAMDRADELIPSQKLNDNFHKALETERKGTDRQRTIFFTRPAYRVAAAVALLILGGGIGFMVSRNNPGQERLAGIEREMELTRQQLNETKQLMLGLLGNDLSASQRIKGVSVALALPQADPDIVSALFTTFYSDPNTNVRLAALDALSTFRTDPSIRKELILSLSKQTDPIVQIKLIQLMVEMQEKGVVRDLQKLVDDASTTKAVKDEAYSGLMKLS